MPCLPLLNKDLLSKDLLNGDLLNRDLLNSKPLFFLGVIVLFVCSIIFYDTDDTEGSY